MSGILTSPSFLAAVGIILSGYALYVEHKVHHLKDGEEFSAMCDIEAIKASCSAVFQLPQGHLLSYFGLVSQDSLLNVPNAALGLVYYFYQLVLRDYFPYPVTVVASLAAMASSVFLAYHLTLLQELCILCWTTHVLNTLLLYHTLVVIPRSFMRTTTEKLKDA